MSSYQINNLSASNEHIFFLICFYVHTYFSIQHFYVISPNAHKKWWMKTAIVERHCSGEGFNKKKKIPEHPQAWLNFTKIYIQSPKSM